MISAQNSESHADRVYVVIQNTLGIPLETITLDSKIEDLTEDSIQLFELILAFEEAFGIKAEYEDLINIVTVQDVIVYLDTLSSKE